MPGSAIDLDIARLAITFTGAAGQIHRVGPVSARTAEILSALVGRRLEGAGVLPEELQLDRLTVPRLEIDLSLAGDEEVAARIADAVDRALAAQLRLR